MPDQGTSVFVGVDVGTSGVRALAITEDGSRIASAQQPLRSGPRRGALHEQDPLAWWSALCDSTRTLVAEISRRGARYQISGVCVASTSGTLVLTDPAGRPVRPALLYDDPRGTEFADSLNARLGSATLNASFSLAKTLWVRHNQPEVWDRTRYLLHPADWLAGRFTNRFGVSDYSNALKLGYDPELRQWGRSVILAGIASEYFPQVFAPGERIGEVTAEASYESGLPLRVPVFAGATDGTASVVGSGARDAGDSNTVLGTTLVWKILTGRRLADRNGIYSHLHPSGFWTPGAASNTGPGCVDDSGSPHQPHELDQRAMPYVPTPKMCYLLPSRGERFPFCRGDAVTFNEGAPANPDERHAMQIQSLAFVERWGYEVLGAAGAQMQGLVFSTGAASLSPALSQLRADTLGRCLVRVRDAGSALGAAILAATGAVYNGDINSAIRKMTDVVDRHEPSIERHRCLDEYYARFRQVCQRRGYA